MGFTPKLDAGKVTSFNALNEKEEELVKMI
jgi:hypothetical protein